MTQAMPLWTIRGFKPMSWKWVGNLALVVMLSLCLILVGCSFASFTAAIQEDLPVVIQMVSNITNIVAPGVSVEIQTFGGLALASLAILCGAPAIGATQCDATSLVGQYQVATDGPTKATLLQKIQAALAAVNNQLNKIITLGNGIPTSVGAAIVTAVGVALSTITLLISLIPVAQASIRNGTSLKVELNKAQSSGQVVQYPEHASVLKKKYNAAVAPHWPTAVVR